MHERVLVDGIGCLFAGVTSTLPLLIMFFPDLDKMDSMKDEMNQADIAALHHFYSRHISDLPDDQALTQLFAQVRGRTGAGGEKLIRGSPPASVGKRLTPGELLSLTDRGWI